MKNKSILSILLLAVSALVFTSCLKNDDEVFDESSSARLEQAIQKARKVLRGAENGWVMDYYIGDKSSSGGYAFIVKFDSLTCTASSEATDTIVDTSYYKMTTDNGPVLSFDTYNKVLHKFATPSSSEYEGKHADFEFVVMSAEPDEVVLKGKRTGNLCYLHPLKDTPEAYLAKVAEMQDSLIVSSGSGKVGDMSINATIDLDGRQISFVNPNDTSKNASCAFTYTDKGIRLSKKVTFASKPFSEFSYDVVTRKLSCTDEGNTDFVMDGFLPDTWRDYDVFEGTYDFAYSDGSTVKRVTLEKNSDGSTYKMIGLNNKYNLILTYSKSRGALMIEPQTIGEASPYIIKLCMLDKKGESLSWASKIGIVFKWNGNEDSPVYKAETNGNEDFISGGIILWLFKDGEAQNGKEVVSPWFSNHSEWTIGGDYALESVTSLTKVN